MPRAPSAPPPKLTVMLPVEMSPLLSSLYAPMAFQLTFEATLSVVHPPGTAGVCPFAKMIARSPASVPLGSVTVSVVGVFAEVMFEPRIVGTKTRAGNNPMAWKFVPS